MGNSQSPFVIPGYAQGGAERRSALTRGDLAKPRPGERRLVRFRDLPLVHARLHRTTPACRAKRLDSIRRTGEESLDIAFQAVPHPAPNAARAGFHFHPGAVADALDIAADRHPNDHLVSGHSRRVEPLRGLTWAPANLTPCASIPKWARAASVTATIAVLAASAKA